MSITTYADLQTAVKRWLHRGDVDALIPDFITLGEARINRLLRLPSLQTTVAITPSATERYVALPDRFFELLAFVDDQGEPLRALTAPLLEVAAAGTTAGRPRYYRITSRIDFERVADGAYAFAMTYKQRLDLAADGTNDVLSQFPDLYLYGALLAATPYLRNDQRILVWGEMFNVALREANDTVRGHVLVRTEIPTDDVFDINTG